MLYSIAAKFVQSREDAEDLIQDTFLRWLSADWKKIKNHKAYLVQSVKNACLDYLAKIKKEKDAKLELLSDFATEQQFNFSMMLKDFEQDLKDKLEEMQRKLNAKEQAVFFLRDTLKFSYEEVGELTDTKIQNARKIFQRAKDHMNSDKFRFSFDKSEFEKHLPSFLNANFSGYFSDYLNKLKNNF